MPQHSGIPTVHELTTRPTRAIEGACDYSWGKVAIACRIGFGILHAGAGNWGRVGQIAVESVAGAIGGRLARGVVSRFGKVTQRRIQTQLRSGNPARRNRPIPSWQRWSVKHGKRASYVAGEAVGWLSGRAGARMVAE